MVVAEPQEGFVLLRHQLLQCAHRGVAFSCLAFATAFLFVTIIAGATATVVVIVAVYKM